MHTFFAELDEVNQLDDGEVCSSGLPKTMLRVTREKVDIIVILKYIN